MLCSIPDATLLFFDYVTLQVIPDVQNQKVKIMQILCIQILELNEY